MALAVVGEAILSASLQALFGEIHSIVDFVRRNKVDEDLLNQLKRKLLLANGVLDDAERQQVTNPDVRQWLEQLQDAIHDAEDLVDQIKTEALRRELEASHRIRRRVRNFFSSRFIVKNVEPKIKNIISSVDDVVNDMERLGLKQGVQASTPFQVRRSSLNVLVKESDVYGREAEKEAIVKFLVSDGDRGEGGNKVSVMSIVGMGGMGKTTLAQLVYNMIGGKAVVMEKPFAITAWITVSDESKSDVFTLTKAIYEKVTKNTADDTVKETFQLQLKLREALEGKKLLFVLDDVWNVDSRIWNELQTPFESAANGSKIIVTTRLPKIAKDLISSDSEVLDLELLSKEDCWKLFSKLAFNNVEPSSYPSDLMEIGEKIVEKCKGNPLAVKSLACLLHSELNPKEWKKVLVNDLWELPQGENDILPALWLSYYYLPSSLKRCFAFCSIFPKDFRFDKEELILLWMAEGFLQPQSNMVVEDVGEKYFEELTSRSFFDVDEENYFTMHDLVNDLAKFVSGKSCLRLDDNFSINPSRKTRHMSYLLRSITDGTFDNSEGLSATKELRTLLNLQSWHGGNIRLFVQNSEQLQSMQCLRVVSLCESFHLESVGKLKLLRYLDLSYNYEIETIPDTICMLYNLQTLLLRCCIELVRLPNSIGKLKHLRYLDLFGTPIEKLPDTICTLYNLQKLLLRRCSKLIRLPDSIGKLRHLRYLDLNGTPIDKLPDTICTLYNLQTLLLGRCSKLVRLPDSIGNLRQLRYLELNGTPIEMLPDTICMLSNLQTLLLNGCSKLVRLPDSIGKLRHLRYLDLFLSPIEKLPDELCSLQELHVLVLSRCNKITHLPTNITRLTNLRKLDIFETPLKEMPRGMSSLKKLQILRKFIVGKNSGLIINELGNLQDLRGDLEITGLENVVEVKDVSTAILKHAHQITHLKLKWNGHGDDFKEPQVKALEVLGRLQPYINIKELRIQNYGGRSFPGWVGHHSFCHIKLLFLEGCKQCCRLPTLGGLPSLEELEISEFDMLETIDNEFYVAASSSSSSSFLSLFKSLKRLKFRRMPKWTEWSSSLGRAFSNLEELELWSCPKLEGACLPDNLPSLKRLDVMYSSHHLVSSLSRCHCPSLRVLQIRDCSEMKSFPPGRLPSSIESIVISECRELESLSEEGYWPCSSLISLQINGCDNLFVHSSTKWNLGMLTSLTSLIIKYVEMGGVDLFPQEEGQLPATLTSLYLGYPGNLKSLNVMAFRCLTSLTSLSIVGMDMGGVGSFPEEEGQLPTTLSSLWLQSLKNLKSLNRTAFQHLTSLQTLRILYCEQLQCLPEGLPASLSQLHISGCPLLTPRCKRGKGQDWEKIKDIPSLLIN